jgi:AmiR/NasT family two-component response regulator
VPLLGTAGTHVSIHDDPFEPSQLLDNRVAVAQATGVIMQSHDLDVDEASEWLRIDAAALGMQEAEFAHIVLDSNG